ncbi:MAG: hypothetical protein JO071_15605 [Deltaproteobacteria bacterium]|nr:hypothetical protein [Deltaproteobacteria bacterium]
MAYRTSRRLAGLCHSAGRLIPWILLSCGAATVQARVIHVVVDSRSPEVGPSPTSIAYERIRGVIYGEVDPRNPLNAVIQDVALAPRNGRGMVEYATTFTLIKPAAMSQASGLLLYEVVNRGGSILPSDLSTGDTFLRSGWQGDLPFRGKSVYGTDGETIQVPIAKNADGSTITGPALLRFANMKQGASSVPTHSAAGYASSGAPPLPVDTETSDAVLTSRSFESVTGVAGGVQTIASSDWSWGDCSEAPFPGRPDPKFICLREGFDASRLYQLSYTAKEPQVLGLGLAAIRDVVAFFHYAPKDDEGWPNPIAGAVRFTIGEGASQSGNLLRTLINLGFNEDEERRRVFDGAMPTIAARQTPINFRFAVPGGASGVYEPGSDGTLWWSHWPDATRHQRAAGLLDRCTATQTCPLIVEVLGSSEFWSLRASPDFVGTNNQQDIPLPKNVRRYYIASTQHGGGKGGFQSKITQAGTPSQGPLTPAGCVLPPNPNPMREIEGALLVALKQWVMNGAAPPPSVYPSLADGALVEPNANAMHFPAVPGLPQPDGVVNPLLVYDFGKDFEAEDLSGVILSEPPTITNVINARVPRVDTDGNELGGIHTVLQQAALGTYLGWNVTSGGFFKGQYCSLTGGYLPLLTTHAERESAHDRRLSLEERYGTHKGFVCVARRAANQLVTERFLLRDDADRIIQEAEASEVLVSGNDPSDADQATTARLCAMPQAK